VRVLFVWPSKDSFGFKPIGLSLLSGIARSLGWETKLFDTTEFDFGFADNTQAGESAKVFKPVNLSQYGHVKGKFNLNEKFTKVLDKFKPDCLALSVLCDEYLIANEISSISKRIRPELPIIWGGKYPTLNPEKSLKMFNADFVCASEGLDAFPDFLKAFSGNGDLYNIPNIWAKKKDGSIVQNNIRPLRNNLDDLPYVDWEMFDKRHFYKPYDGDVYIGGDHMLNWGCPYSCSYCINHFYHEAYDNKYFMRRYSSKRIINELKALVNKYNLQFFRFHDEDFLMRPLEGFRELSDTYRLEINLPFTIETNPKSVTKERVELLQNMNCASVSLAVETGNNELRRNLLKRVDSEEDIIRAFALLKDAGIRTAAFTMLGIPFETRETYNDTVALVKKSNAQYPMSGFFYPFEGTKLRDVSTKEGFFNPEDEEKFVYKRDKPALSFKNLSEKELIEMRKVFILYVKLPKSYEAYIKRSETQDDLGVKLRKRLIEIFDKTVLNNDGWYVDDGLMPMYLGELSEITQNSGTIWAK
jgi:radical SAM superfamily enzyme YgiQ (UPF0313 family)